ncbi:MAG: hypothetical protein ACOC0N_09570 [Chroococcales cyanobacterium]
MQKNPKVLEAYLGE